MRKFVIACQVSGDEGKEGGLEFLIVPSNKPGMADLFIQGQEELGVSTLPFSGIERILASFIRLSDLNVNIYGINSGSDIAGNDQIIAYILRFLRDFDGAHVAELNESPKVSSSSKAPSRARPAARAPARASGARRAPPPAPEEEEGDDEEPIARKPTTSSERRAPARKAAPVKQASNSRARWTDEDRERLVELNDEGMSIEELAVEFGRTERAIRMQLANLDK